MEGRPHGSLTSSDGYGRANSASYPAYTDSGHGRQGQQRLEHSKHGQLRWRGGLMGLSHLATATAGPTAPHTQHTHTVETTAGLTGPCLHSRDDGRAYRALLTQRRRRQGLQGLAHTAETTAGPTGPCSHSGDYGRAYRALLTQQRRRQGLQGLAHKAETTAGLTGSCSHSRDDGRAYRALLTQSRTSAGSTAP